METVRLEVHAAPMMTQLKLFVAEVANRPCKISHAFVDRFNAMIKAGGINVEQSITPGTGCLVLSLELSDAFAEFMAAARAGDFDVV